MEEEPWHVRRLRELEAAAPPKRRKPEFILLPLWLAKAVFDASRSPAAPLVMAELLRLRRRHGTTFPLPNGRLETLGVSRHTKRRVLRDLERAGLVVIERPPDKTPVVTLVLT